MESWLDQVKEEIGGYDDLIQHLIDKITLAKNDTSLSRLPRSKGTLLHGLPGTGKTALAISIAKCSKLPYYHLDCPNVFQAEEGMSELKLAEFFKQAKDRPMSILIMDELDMIAGQWTSKKNALDMRLASMLMTMIDQLENAYIIGITSRLHAIDASFLRSGRLDDLQLLNVKTPKQRYDILNILTKRLPFESNKKHHAILSSISKITHGFVPSDLESLISLATLTYIKQHDAFLTYNHLQQALQAIPKPSNLNEYTIKIPTVRFGDLYGMDDVIQTIRASVIQPFHHPENYLSLGISPPKGILIHGPTGVGKTMLCSALASEAGVNFMLVESSQVRSKIVGESEKTLAHIFQQARANAPCILFIDQIDMLLPKRGTSQSTENTSDRIVTGFLTEMDGLLTKTDNNAHIDVLVVAGNKKEKGKE
ncbi:MAG: P-loop containing nucleoside triphosphate hydrolase protein [Benjaminiella poitrasii]|nr:MAG: P-loop containing nucleoside triphosphate hydrolase protein [Benjaminiella poitrasii]